jgi:hypothetical protein
MNDVHGSAGGSAGEIRRRLTAELGLPSRLRYAALLVAGLAVAGVSGGLAATEPALPNRTRVALIAVFLGGAAWAVFSGYVLRRRRVLFATHRVAAAGLAMVLSGLFTAGALALGLSGAVPAGGAFTAAAVGGGMLALAGVAWLAARGRVHRLETRRREIERLLEAGH